MEERACINQIAVFQKASHDEALQGISMQCPHTIPCPVPTMRNTGLNLESCAEGRVKLNQSVLFLSRYKQNTKAVARGVERYRKKSTNSTSSGLSPKLTAQTNQLSLLDEETMKDKTQEGLFLVIWNC